MVRTRVLRLVVSVFCAAGCSGWITAQASAAGIVTLPALVEGLINSMAIGQVWEPCEGPCIQACPCSVVQGEPVKVIIELCPTEECDPDEDTNVPMGVVGTEICWYFCASDLDKNCACEQEFPPDCEDSICGQLWLLYRGNELVGYGGDSTFSFTPSECGLYSLSLKVDSCSCDSSTVGILFSVTGANGEGPGLGDCGEQGGQNCGNGDSLMVDKGVLEADNQSTATASHEGSGEVCWSLVGDTHGATIDPVTGVITAGHEEGWLTIRAIACAGPDCTDCDSNCFEEIRIWQGGDCEGCQDSGCIEGSARIGLSSIDIAFPLGTTLDGEQVGYLSIFKPGLSDELLTPDDALDYPHTPHVTVLRDGAGILRQILAPRMLVEIKTLFSPTTRYVISFYGENNIGEIGSDGFYTHGGALNTWECEYTATDPSFTVRLSSLGDGLRAVTYAFSEGNAAEDMNLVVSSTNGTIFRHETMQWLVPGVQSLHSTLDENGNEIRSVWEAFVDNGLGGRVVAERIVDPGGLNRTTTYQHYPATAPTGKRGRLKSVVDPEGLWAWYDYDASARQVLVVRAWKGVGLPVTGDPDPASARATYYDYQWVDPSDSLAEDPERPRTVTQTIEGVTSRKNYYAYYRDTSSGAKVVIEERCHAAAAPYGDPLNLRTTTTYVPGDDNKIAKIIFPDGTMDEYTYEVGELGGVGSIENYTFEELTAESTSIDLRETLTHYTDAGQGLLLSKSTREIRITDAADNERVTQTDFWDGANWVRFDWTFRVFDYNNHLEDTFYSNGTCTQSDWSCCAKIWDTDSTWFKTTYTYDDLGRKTAETKQSLNTATFPAPFFGMNIGPFDAQPAVKTTFTLDALGRVIGTTTSYDDGMGSFLVQLTSSREFDQAGRLLSETDEAGLETLYDYATLIEGRAVIVTTPDGLSRITAYFHDGQLDRINGTGVVDESHTYGIETDGTQWTKVAHDPANGPSETSYFDLLGRKIREERTGLADQTIRTYFEYDQGGRLTRRWSNILIVDSSGGPTIAQLPIGGGGIGGGGFGGGFVQLETVVSGLGDVLFVYDAVGALTRTCADINRNGTIDLAGPDRVTDTDTSFVPRYGEWWRQTQTRIYPANNASSTPVSTERQQLTGLWQDCGFNKVSARSESEDIHGNITTSETLHGPSWSLVINKTTPPTGGPQISETRGGLLHGTQTSAGQRFAYHHDAIGRRIQTVDPRTGVSTTNYNGLGQVDWVEDANQNRTTFQYDSAGRRINVTNPAGNVTRYTYGTTGLLERVWGDVPQPVEFAYDSQTLAMTSMSTFRGGTGWNGSTWPATPGLADVTQWNRDPRTGHLLDKTYPDGSQVTYTYNSNMALDKRTWARGGGSLTTTYAYHGQTGQLTTINYSDATPDVSYTHDRLGRLSTVADAAGSRMLSYNAALQPDAEVINGSGSGLYDKVIQRTYQPSGTSGLPPGRYTGFTVGPDVTPPAADYTAGYEYDPLTGRFSGITGTALPPGGVQYAYLADSDLIERLEYKDASTVLATTTRAYEAGRDLLTSVENRWGASVISKYDYLSDNLGQRSSVVYTGSAFAAAHHDRYFYNPRNELSASQRYEGTDPQASAQVALWEQFHSYLYDPIGNRSQSEAGIWPAPSAVHVAYTANNLNQYTAAVENSNSTETFLYDGDGNMTQDGSFAYSWDAANRLITVAPVSQPVAGDKLLTFTYDYRGRRVRKVVQAWDPALNGGAGGWAATPTEDRRFVYDGWNLVLELDGLSSNATLRKYAWGLDLSGTVQGAGGIGGLLAVEDTAGTAVTTDDAQYLYFYDGNGNVGQLIDLSAGTLAAHYEYDPYGNITDSTGSYADANPFRFSTKYLDSETSLSYYGYRYYSPRLGRWLSRDLLAFAGLNVYGFVENDPVNLYDLFGLMTEKQCKKHYSKHYRAFDMLRNLRDTLENWRAYDQQQIARLQQQLNRGVLTRAQYEAAVEPHRNNFKINSNRKSLINQQLRNAFEQAKLAYWMDKQGCKCKAARHAAIAPKNAREFEEGFKQLQSIPGDPRNIPEFMLWLASQTQTPAKGKGLWNVLDATGLANLFRVISADCCADDPKVRTKADDLYVKPPTIDTLGKKNGSRPVPSG